MTASDAAADAKPVVDILYCRQCKWLLRAAWMAQELLSTFEEELSGVTLRSGTGGVFVITIDGAPVWSRKAEGRFPDVVELKQRVRDLIAPDRALGHLDRRKEPPA
jgi:selenoprotein W-related protein